MNKKFLICGLIAAGLFLTACSKKEQPKDENQSQMETSTQEQQPTELKPLQEAQNQQSTTERTVVIERMETPNTTTEIRREQHHAAKPVETPVKEEPKAEPKTEVSTANTEEQPARSTTKQNRSEDDAVADAIAAATPALKN